VAEGVVDVLEVVQIQEHHAHHAGVPATLCQGQLEAIQRQHPVGQTSERVVIGLPEQLLFVALANADVLAQDQIVRGKVSIVLDRRYDNLLPEPLAILPGTLYLPCQTPAL